jgi:hypothetical protein
MLGFNSSLTPTCLGLKGFVVGGGDGGGGVATALDPVSRDY